MWQLTAEWNGKRGKRKEGRGKKGTVTHSFFAQSSANAYILRY